MARREMKTAEEIKDVVTPENETVVEKKKEVTGIVVDCKKLNIRKAPKDGAEVVTIVDAGTKLTICNIEKAIGDWYKVKIDNGTSGFNGYCMKKFVKLD